jgi:hypothetical protein
MKRISFLTIAMAFAVFSTVDLAQAQLGSTVTRTGPNGKPVVVKLDGKYSTCIRDSQRLGYSASSATRYCDKKPNLKR